MSDFPDPVEGLLPHGSLCTLSGATGVGKTAFVASAISAMQRGEPFLGHQTHPIPIGVLACDRPWRDHAAWFEKAGCQPFAHRSLRDEDYPWAILRDFRNVHLTFGKLIDSLELPPGGLVIADPVSLFVPGRLIDYKDVAIGMGLIDQQLKLRQLSMLGIFHVSKQKATGGDRYLRPQDRILGSTALLAYSETAFYLLSPAEAQKPHYEFGYLCHQLPEMSFAYKRNKANGLFLPAEFLDLQQDEETVLSLLPDNHEICLARSVWVKKIEDSLGCDDDFALAIIRRLIRTGRVERVGRGLYRRAKPH